MFHRESVVKLLFVLLAAFVAVHGDAKACPLCFSGMVITPGQQLDSADEAVLAVPTGDDGEFRIVAVVKGNVDTDEVIVEPGATLGIVGPLTSPGGPPAPPQAEAAISGKALLLVRNKLTERWASLGAIDEAYAGWLREVAATNRGEQAVPVKTWPRTIAWSYLSDAEWRDRLALVTPYFENSEPLAAEIAYGELARAPYGEMRLLKPRLDPDAIAGWIDDPALASRRPAYTLLVGIAGRADDAGALEEHIDTALRSGDAANLAPMLAADLEIRGPDRVEWIEATFFADRTRTLQEIEAALLALSVHGGADGVVPRQRIVEAYRTFIRERGPMAGFVAQDLADWKAWDATADYVQIVRSGAVKDPAGQFAIANYLRESPDPIARAAVDALVGTAN